MRDFIQIIESAEEPRLIEGPWVDGRCLPRLQDGSVPRYLFRVMSRAEYETGAGTRRFMSRDGRLHASARPEVGYSDGYDNVLVAIAYRDEDGWKAKWGMGGSTLYAITNDPIPASRVHMLASGDRYDLQAAQVSHLLESVQEIDIEEIISELRMDWRFFGFESDEAVENIRHEIPRLYERIMKRAVAGNIPVYRVIDAPPTWKYHQEVEQHYYWAWNRAGARAYETREREGDVSWFLAGSAPISRVDWNETLARCVSPAYADEYELCLVGPIYPDSARIIEQPHR
jgi:hypothetical protein